MNLAMVIQHQAGAPASQRVSPHLLCLPLLVHLLVVQRSLGAETTLCSSPCTFPGKGN